MLIFSQPHYESLNTAVQEYRRHNIIQIFKSKPIKELIIEIEKPKLTSKSPAAEKQNQFSIHLFSFFFVVNEHLPS